MMGTGGRCYDSMWRRSSLLDASEDGRRSKARRNEKRRDGSGAEERAG